MRLLADGTSLRKQEVARCCRDLAARAGVSPHGRAPDDPGWVLRVGDSDLRSVGKRLRPEVCSRSSAHTTEGQSTQITEGVNLEGEARGLAKDTSAELERKQTQCHPCRLALDKGHGSQEDQKVVGVLERVVLEQVWQQWQSDRRSMTNSLHVLRRQRHWAIDSTTCWYGIARKYPPTALRC